MTPQDGVHWANTGWRRSPFFKSSIPGLNAAGIDTDGQFGYQCKDFANAYSAFLGHPLKAGNANQAWTQAQDPFYTKQSAGQPGDLAVFNIGQYGHIDIVVEPGFKSVGQNWYNANSRVGSPPALIQHSVQNVFGFLRPTWGGDMLSAAQVNELAMIAWNRPASDTEKAVYPTQPTDQVLNEILTSPLNVKIRTLAQRDINNGE